MTYHDEGLLQGRDPERVVEQYRVLSTAVRWTVLPFVVLIIVVLIISTW